MAEAYKANASGFAAYATPADLIEYRDWRLIADLIRDDDKRAANITEVSGTNEVQSLAVDATGGTFTISFGGQTTSAIAYNATASTVMAALGALSSIGSGNASVTGGPGASGGLTPYVIEFVGSLSSANQDQITASAASLTGGGASATPSTTTTGAAGNTKVARALNTATGMIEAEIFHGGRYSRADMKRLLALVEDPDDDDEEKYTMTRDYIRQLTCDLAFWVLIKRRKPDAVAEKINGVKEAMETLVRLRNGEAIFPFLETEEAGVMGYTPLDPHTSKAAYEARFPYKISSDSRRMFGRRSGDSNY